MSRRFQSNWLPYETAATKCEFTYTSPAGSPVSLPPSSGLHGYTHERQTRLTLEQQKDVLDRSYEVLTKFNNGVPPRGSCAPCWDTSRDNTRLLLEKGIEYGKLFTVRADICVTLNYPRDHSNMAHECGRTLSIAVSRA